MQCDAGLENLCIDVLDGAWYGFPVELLILVYAFIALARVADNYLVTSLETLCVRRHVREDVAGASFMAFGSAAPEIIVNAISTAKAAVSSPRDTNLGIGAIVGSGMIAFTLIPGACAVFSKDTLQLKRRPLLRDLIFYASSLMALSVAISDGVVDLPEAACMLSAYFLYLLVVVSSSHVRNAYRVRVLGLPAAPQRSFVQSSSTVTLEVPPADGGGPGGDAEEERTTLIEPSAGPPPQQLATASWATGQVTESSSAENLLHVSSLDVAQVEASAADADVDDASWTVAMPLELEQLPSQGGDPGAPAAARPAIVARAADALEIAAAPLDALFRATCPDCVHDGPNAHWYPVTFLVSFLWVSLFSMVISAVVSHWGETSRAPESFLGLAVIAIGAEIPDCIQSVTVARRGYGSMAVSNSLGSQIINILIGLGLPWTISNSVGRPIRITDVPHIQLMALMQSANVVGLTLLLLGAACALREAKATLTKTKGLVLVAMYVCAVGTYAVIAFAVDSEGADEGPDLHLAMRAVAAAGRATPPGT